MTCYSDYWALCRFLCQSGTCRRQIIYVTLAGKVKVSQLNCYVDSGSDSWTYFDT